MIAFTPYPGFDPLDGDDPRVTLSRDNPCAANHHHSNSPHQGKYQVSNLVSVGGEVVNHAGGNKS